MTRKATLGLVWILATAPALLFAKDIEVAVIGITQGGAPAFEETFDKRLRENLSMLPELAIVDYAQTQAYRRKIRFDEFPTVSRKLVESLKQYCTDSTMFVWGSVKKSAIKGIRKSAIKGFIRGEITISLNMYSLRYKNYAFSGDIQTDFKKRKGFVFFGEAENELLPSAIDRNEIMEQLLDSAALKSAQMVATVIKSERLHAEKESESGGANKYEIPSVSDMFNVPSVEAASVNKKSAKIKTPIDTVSNPGPAMAPKAPEKPAPPAKPNKPIQPVDTVKPVQSVDTVKPIQPVDTVKAGNKK